MSTFQPPPHGLRLISLPDRLILHDITFALGNRSAANRNALIDAANCVHTRQHPPRRAAHDLLVDLDSPISSTTTPDNAHRYLVFPFAASHSPRDPPAPYEASSPELAGLPSHGETFSLQIDAIAAFIGTIPLHTAVFAIVATQVKLVAILPSGRILAISKVALIPLSPLAPSKEDKETSVAITKLLESGALYYSVDTDISRAYGSKVSSSRKRPFQWNFPMLSQLPSALRPWAPSCIYGFVSEHRMSLMTSSSTGRNISTDFFMALVSRRSRRRAGTRFITRGVDGMGDVANFVETEQLVWPDLNNGLTDIKANIPVSSFVIIRGSIPVFWRQNNGIARPAPELDAGLVASHRAYTLHFDALRDAYSDVCAVSLINKHGEEGLLAQAFDRHHDLYCQAPSTLDPKPTLIAFDFHSYCAGKEYERGLSLLMSRLDQDLEKMGFNVYDATRNRAMDQNGVFRINCVDCLDRTNVVQTMICRKILASQLDAVVVGLQGDGGRLMGAGSPTQTSLFAESEDRFKHVWGDHADAISKQYSGTGALKTDFTRTGKRSTTGVIGDGVKSVMRMYYKNFVDEGRQEVIDVVCGNAVIRQLVSFGTSNADSNVNPISSAKRLTGRHSHSSAGLRTESSTNAGSARKTSDTRPSSLWYSFDAMRINAGGDKQAVMVELHDNIMYVTTAEGLCFEYPRDALLSWSKSDDTKSSDRRAPSRLRLIYKPSYSTPATMTSLDLQFRGGMSARENFLRALLSWAAPPCTKLMSNRTAFRVRVLVASEIGEHSLRDWGLNNDQQKQHEHELVVLTIPNVSASSRGFGLAAVPIDLDSSHDLVLISAYAMSERGPAVAVLASTDVAPTVMGVDEASWIATSSSNPGQFSTNGVAAVALEACGTSICVVAARLASKAQVYTALMELRLGKQGHDMTAQYDHFVMTGLMGENPWSLSSGQLSASKFAASSSSANVDERQWMQLEDGSFCYALDNGISIRRNSLPTLRYDDFLFKPTGLSTSNGVHCVCDGLVDGKPAPALPKRLCRAAVTVSQLRAEDVKIPRGVEISSQMNCSVILSCALATSDMVTSRPTLRPSTYPEWPDVLTLHMMPSDEDDVMRAFVFGQVVVPNVLGDPFLAGSFVIPLATAPSGFDVRCRLGGHVTARLVGHVAVDTSGEKGGGHDALVDGNRTGGTIGAGEERRRNSNNSGGGSKSNSMNIAEYAAGFNQLALKKPSQMGMDDVNQRIEQARKKGAKQMKSVVSKLSALMSSSSLSSSSSRMASNTTMTQPPSSSSLSSNPHQQQHHQSSRSQADGNHPHHQPRSHHSAHHVDAHTMDETRMERTQQDKREEQHHRDTSSSSSSSAYSHHHTTSAVTRTRASPSEGLRTPTTSTTTQTHAQVVGPGPSHTVASVRTRHVAAEVPPTHDTTFSTTISPSPRYLPPTTTTATSTSTSSVKKTTPPPTAFLAGITNSNTTSTNTGGPATGDDGGHRHRTTRPTSTAAGADALLLGLADSKTQSAMSANSTTTTAARTTTSALARHADPVPLHVSSTNHDPLLSGLASQKQRQKQRQEQAHEAGQVEKRKNRVQVGDVAVAQDDDDWGEFTSA